MKIALYAHGGSANHGCEALVRSTIGIIGDIGNQFTIFSEKPEEDIRYGLGSIATIEASQNPLPKGIRNIAYRISMHFDNSDRNYYRHIYRSVAQKAGNFDLALAIGGDNYCYKGFAERFGVLNDIFAKKGVPTILWGCSIDPERIDEAMLSDLRKYRLITARESITHKALLDNGLKTVHLVPDSAFSLPTKLQPLPQGIGDYTAVGINISPLIIRHEKTPGIALESYCRLIHYILDNTTMSVLLIPHVVWAENDDCKPLRQLYESFRNTNRVTMVEDADVKTLKGYISRCRFLVAARTHASIAGYSSGVPTVVVGYSVKAEGIAKDLFGTSDNYVVNISALKDSDELTKSFKWMMLHEKDIRKHYEKVLDAYTSQAEKAKRLISQIWKSLRA